jgi:ribosomal protein S18 acetylase RimI-like enzyme
MPERSSQTPGITIRRLELPRDREVLRVLHMKYDLEYGFTRKAGELEGILDTIESRSGIYTCLGLFDKEDPVGYVRFYERISTSSCDLVGMLDIVEIDRPYRGRGLGRLLMEEVLNLARKLGFARIDLLADLDNEVAVGLYKSLGFQGRERFQMHCVLKHNPDLDAYFAKKKAQDERGRGE